jgi:23S rRNA pseudouridine1911/1915/1917 synthase
VTREENGGARPVDGASRSVTRLVVAQDEAGLRLDAFLARHGLAPSAAGARRLLATGAVRVNARAAPKGARLQPGQTVEIASAGPAAPLVPDEHLRLDVLYEDDTIVAVDKPAGVPSHPLRPGELGTLASALVQRYPECAAASVDPREGGLGHRLDIGTSGVIVAARSREVWALLRASLGGESAEKVYLAEVAGSPAGSEPIVVEAAIGRSGRRAGKVRIGLGRGLLPARTEVRVREHRGDTTLVEARLHRGRAHQVRAHLAHLGHPVLGDDDYGDEVSRSIASALGVRGLRLHALRVSFAHPVTAKSIVIEAPPPAWAVRRR